MDRFLTKSRATWILSGILLMAALNRQDSFVYAMFLGVTAMGALGYLLPWLALRSSTLERTGQWLQETQLDEDRALDLGLRLRQGRWWPAWVVEVEARWEWSGREFLSRSTIATSRRGSAVPVLDNIRFGCRGHYYLRELRLRSGFPLGLVHAQRVLQVEQFAVVVRPAQSPVVLPAAWSASPDILGDDCRGHAGDSLELNSLRPYEPGHAVRNVDWRASARAGDLITRQYQRPASILVKLAIDPPGTAAVGLADGPAEWSIKVAAGVCASLERQGMRFELVHPGETGARDMDTVLRELAIATPSATTWGMRLHAESAQLRRGEQLLVVAAADAAAPVLLTAALSATLLGAQVMVVIATWPGAAARFLAQGSRLRDELQMGGVQAWLASH